MDKVRLRPWDSAAQLTSSEEAAHYLDACLEEGDPILVNHALGVIARAHGITNLARSAGLSEEDLCIALSADGSPKFSTVVGVLKVLHIRLRAELKNG